MRVLVTGGSGFVGRHLVCALRGRLPHTSMVIPTSQTPESDLVLGACRGLDVTDLDAVRRVLREVAPTHVVHLAGVSALRHVGVQPLQAWSANVMGTLNLA